MCWCKHNALRLSIRRCIHQPEQLGILRKIVVKGHHRLRHDQQSAADLCILDVPLFLVGNVQQPRQIVGIVGGLVQQLDPQSDSIRRASSLSSTERTCWVMEVRIAPHLRARLDS